MENEVAGKACDAHHNFAPSMENVGTASTSHVKKSDSWSTMNATMLKILSFLEMMGKVQGDIKSMVTSIEKFFVAKHPCLYDCNASKNQPERSNCEGGPNSDSVVILKSIPDPLSNGKVQIEDAVDSDYYTPEGQLDKDKMEVPISAFKRNKGKELLENDFDMDYVTPLGEVDKGNMEVPISAFKRRKGKEVLREVSGTQNMNAAMFDVNVQADVPKSAYKRQKNSSAPLSPNLPKSRRKSREGVKSSKNLFPSPNTPRMTKKKKTTHTKPRTVNVGTGDSTSQALNLLTPTKPYPIPPKFRAKFKPTPAMGLRLEEHAIALYVYGIAFDESEVLFRSGDVEMTRKEFWDIRPGFKITGEILDLLCKAETLAQCLYAVPNTWCLPPSFSEEALNGMEVQQALTKFGDPWMPPSTDLRYIYVPLCDNKIHWYMLVVSLMDKEVYWLDSYKKPSELHSRLGILRFMHGYLSKLILEMEAANNWIYNMPDISGWQLQAATGIPNCGDSSNSILWVCDWLDMVNYFNPNVLGKMDEDAVYMRVMLNLVTARCNCVGKSVEAAARSFLRNQTPATI